MNVEAAKSPVPLQAVVGVICDMLADLQIDDQVRALEAVRITLGAGSPATTTDATDARMELLAEFCRSLRADQMGVLVQTFDMTQKILFMEVMNVALAPK